MFIAKNLLLRRKLGIPIRGNNRQANVFIAHSALFILFALYASRATHAPGSITLAGTPLLTGLALLTMVASLVVSATSLLGLKDSWRVGVIETQTTELVESGIYAVSRNPYFLSYILTFIAYTLLLQNVILLVLCLGGTVLVHAMVRKEEDYLLRSHGDVYRRYCKRVPRYLLI